MNKLFTDFLEKRFVDKMLDETEEGQYLKAILGEQIDEFRDYMRYAYSKLGNIGLGAFVAMFFQYIEWRKKNGETTKKRN